MSNIHLLFSLIYLNKLFITAAHMNSLFLTHWLSVCVKNFLLYFNSSKENVWIIGVFFNRSFYFMLYFYRLCYLETLKRRNCCCGYILLFFTAMQLHNQGRIWWLTTRIKTSSKRTYFFAFIFNINVNTNNVGVSFYTIYQTFTSHSEQFQ